MFPVSSKGIFVAGRVVPEITPRHLPIHSRQARLMADAAVKTLVTVRHGGVNDVGQAGKEHDGISADGQQMTTNGVSGKGIIECATWCGNRLSVLNIRGTGDFFLLAMQRVPGDAQNPCGFSHGGRLFHHTGDMFSFDFPQ